MANSFGSGEGGDWQDLQIQTEKLIVSDRAFIGVNGEGTGNAGNLQIAAESIQLNNGLLNAETASGEGGNIFLNTQFLQLRENSNISTEAGGSGNGGNIAIDADVMAALENSDIIAKSAQGLGGRVIIDSQGIFGTEFREQQTLNSDITATSELGSQFSGVVEISTPDAEPSAGLVELQTNVVDVQGLVDRDVYANSENSFYITGRGELPPNPDQPLSSYIVWVDERSTPPLKSLKKGGQGGSTNSQLSTVNHQQISPEILEATGWAIAPNGQIILTANGAFVDSGSADWRHHPICIKDIPLSGL